MARSIRCLQRLQWIVFLAAVAWGPAAALAADSAAANEAGVARQIFETTGVKGGLIIHVGCGEGRLTAALGAGESYLVHALDANAAHVEKARAQLQAAGLYGRIAVDQWSGGRLPYVDNLANLLVISDANLKIADQEIQRVLAPGGTAVWLNANAGIQKKSTKPRPAELDQWTHYLHDPSNNAVAHDTVVGPPRHFQWIGSPRWARHHDRMSSISAMVVTADKMFYIFDEGSTASIMLPSSWTLTARDAFNGTVLWKRPISTWHPHLYPFKSGPAYLARRLVAVGDRVYATLALDAPLTALDAATGKTLRTYENTKATEEVLVSDGVLLVVANPQPFDWSVFKPLVNNIGEEKSRVAKDYPWDNKQRRVMALRADTGEVLWQQENRVVPMTLAADARAVFFHDGDCIVCLDRRNGRQLWRSEPVSRMPSIPTNFAPTLVVYKDVVLFSGGDRSMSALSAADGKKLWSSPHHPSGHNSPEDLLVVGGLAWCGAVANTKDSGVFTGRDPWTGEVKNEFSPDTSIHFMHHRCYRSKATDKYLIPSRTGIELIDPATKHWDCNHWVRSGCVYGIVPCNGMIYTTPHDCACYMEAKLNSFCALTPPSSSGPTPAKISDEGRLERGPVYEQTLPPSALRLPPSDEWPTYRHDGRRSGLAKTAIPVNLGSTWQAKVGGKLTAPVIAEGKLYLASVDEHKLYCLDADSGKVVWSFVAGGRVDSPPTIDQGRALFGSNDGCVYCLRAADGKLIWRFRAAPEDRRLVAYEQIESLWPVSGSVLVQDGTVYCVAGRSMFVDGGLHFLKLDAKTGRKIAEKVLDDRDPQSGENLQKYVMNLNMPVGLPDVLSSDGRYVFMRSQRFDLEGNREDIAPHAADNARQAAAQRGEGVHLFSPTGFLDDSWWHRSYLVYGRSFAQGAGGWPLAGRFAPGGRLLVFDDTTVYGFGRRPDHYKWTTPLEYHFFAASKQPETVAAKPNAAEAAKKRAAMTPEQLAQAKAKRAAKGAKADTQAAANATQIRYQWSEPLPLYVRAMLLSNSTLFIAGPADIVDEEDAFNRSNDPDVLARLREQDEIMQGRKGASLWAVSANDGKKLAEYHLDTLPVFDGMAAANKKLYLVTTDGRVLCYAGR